jgi:HAD superfamily hydrolase (TIGR01450 family)
LQQSFAEHGIDIKKDAGIVVVGFDTSLTYEKLVTACDLLRNGAAFLATNPDFVCPTETGFIPDCGSICALIEAATGKKPLYMGKPFQPVLEFIVNKTGLQPVEMVIVGDRLYTDIAFGINNGVTSVLVLSGETGKEDIKPDYKVEYVFPSLVDICGVI